MKQINLRLRFRKTDDAESPYEIFVYEDKDPKEATWAEVFCGQTKEEAIDRLIKKLSNLLTL